MEIVRDPSASHHERLRLTLSPRLWAVAGLMTLLSLIVLGVPSAVIPNPFFIRMTPTEPFNVAVWLLSAPLAGLLIATYLVRDGERSDVHTDTGTKRVTLGGVGAYLAIGCPICNKVIVAVLGVSGALDVFAPMQPLIGAASVGLLAATLAWRLRMRARGCTRCAPALDRALTADRS
ncbi:MAG: hypothetical protein H0U37_04550 [Chloroflexi bacterium]|nr:hypothetical protein [Chloroflexota bacterium]